MKTDHVFGNHIYVISNYGVARNPIFSSRVDLKTFEELAQKYLSPVCDILSSGYSYNQFQFAVRVNPRNKIEDFYRIKYKDKIKDNLLSVIIPETYIIFSQQVSNLLNAYVKRFNKKYNRIGGLFASRYRKILVESENLLAQWVAKLRDSIPQFRFSRKWEVRKEERCDLRMKTSKEEWNGNHLEFNGANASLKLLDYKIDDLRGCFACLPPKRINSPNISLLWTNFFQKMGFPPPW